MLCKFVWLFKSVAFWFPSKWPFSEKYQKNSGIPSVSNSLDPDQVQCVLGPVCEKRQAWSWSKTVLVDTSRWRVNRLLHFCGILFALSMYWSTKSFEAWLYLQFRCVVLEKKGFRHLFPFIIKALTYTYVPSRLPRLTHSASIVWNRKTQRSLVRGRGTYICTKWILPSDNMHWFGDVPLYIERGHSL